MRYTTLLMEGGTCGSMTTGSGSWGNSARVGSPTFSWSRRCSLTLLLPLVVGLVWLRKSRTLLISLVRSLSFSNPVSSFFSDFCDLGHVGVNLKLLYFDLISSEIVLFWDFVIWVIRFWIWIPLVLSVWASKWLNWIIWANLNFQNGGFIGVFVLWSDIMMWEFCWNYCIFLWC